MLFLGKVLVVAYLGYAALLFSVQRRVAFPGTVRESPRSTASAPEGVTQVWLQTSFGAVEAWYLKAEGSALRPTVIFAHGNGELIEDWLGPMEELVYAGIDALLVEFPGYGHSQGKPSRASLGESFALAFDWLVAQDGVDSDRVIAYGRSMGGAVAGDLSLSRPVRALVLQSTFSSAAAMARMHLVPGVLVRDRFDTERVIEKFSGPVLLMHGTTDDVIPFSHAERLASVREGLAVTELNCAHNDCASEWPVIVEFLVGFLATHDLLDG